MPADSIGLPVHSSKDYNGENYVAMAIESMFAQTFATAQHEERIVPGEKNA